MLPVKIVLKAENGSNNLRNGSLSPFESKRSDFYIYFHNQIIPVMRSRLSCCQLLQQEVRPGTRIFCITEDLNETMFMKIIGFLHGSTLQINTIKELAYLLDIIDFLKQSSLLQLIQDSIQKDIQSYEIFQLLQLAYKFGLQRIFTLCIQYLEVDEFEQIKYNKFDFLCCSFELFQIVLRRHHILKTKGKIKGIDANDILDVITIYCHRNRLSQQLINRLIQKYVESIQNLEVCKTSLRLDKLIGNKQIMQSANIGTDYQQSDNLNPFQSQGNNFFISSLRHQRISKVKKVQSADKKELQMLNLNDISLQFEQQNYQSTQLNQFQIRLNRANILEQNETDLDQAQQLKIKIEKKMEVSQLNQNFNEMNQTRNKEEPQVLMKKISSLLCEYQSAIQEHSQHFNIMKKNAKQAKSSKMLDSQTLK